MIEFNHIVIWNENAFLYGNLFTIESNGMSNPSSIFQNQLRKDLFNQAEVLIFLTDGRIEHGNVLRVGFKLFSKKKNFFSLYINFSFFRQI